MYNRRMVGIEEKLDVHNPNNNLYGCAPCPKCGSRTRWPTQKIHPNKPQTILCDSCGYEIKYVDDNREE